MSASVACATMPPPAIGGDRVVARPSLPVTVSAGRKLNHAAGTIALSVLIDSAMKHYRGDFHNPVMATPLLTSAASLAMSIHGAADERGASHIGRDAAYIAAGLAGVVGTGFHFYNVTKRVGGFSWQNLLYAAPLGAPMAMALSGLVGFMAERVRNADDDRPTVFGVDAGRAVAATTALSLLGTTAEAGLLHFRGALHNPVMLLPVTMPPVAAALLGEVAFGRAEPRPITRGRLIATAAMGVAGVALPSYGVSRAMGGWKNWRQNFFSGPPLPAPPAFTGLALAGLAALSLLRDKRP